MNALDIVQNVLKNVGLRFMVIDSPGPHKMNLLVVQKVLFIFPTIERPRREKVNQYQSLDLSWLAMPILIKNRERNFHSWHDSFRDFRSRGFESLGL